MSIDYQIRPYLMLFGSKIYRTDKIAISLVTDQMLPVLVVLSPPAAADYFQFLHIFLESIGPKEFRQFYMKKQLSLLLLIIFASTLSLRQQHLEYDSDQHHPAHNPHFTLSFDHASREGISQTSNSFAVDWNGKRIKEWAPNDYSIHHQKFDAKALQGKNTVNFVGTGISDGLGQQIDNVKLTRKTFCGFEDLIKNGDFESGHTLGHGWTIFKNGDFQGWSCVDEMEVGWSKLYNKQWPDTHVCELDARSNSNIYQEFWLDKKNRYQDKSQK